MKGDRERMKDTPTTSLLLLPSLKPLQLNNTKNEKNTNLKIIIIYFYMFITFQFYL